MKLSLPLFFTSLVATPVVARAADASSTLVLDPIQSSFATIFGAFGVVLVLAVTIASHQRP